MCEPEQTDFTIEEERGQQTLRSNYLGAYFQDICQWLWQIWYNFT